MTIGEKIKSLRLEKGLTQKQLGDLCSMADSAIRRYELGSANPKIETLEKIANALNVPLSELYQYETFKNEMDTLITQQKKAEDDFRNNLYNLSKMLNVIALSELLKSAMELIRNELHWSFFYDTDAIKAFVGDALISSPNTEVDDKDTENQHTKK